MTSTAYVIVIACGALALLAYGGLILWPAVTAYSRVWERLAAGVLSLYVLAAFVLAGVALGAAVVWFWGSV